jgi:hypothetical protein
MLLSDDEAIDHDVIPTKNGKCIIFTGLNQHQGRKREHKAVKVL